jgi:hypothetical protein
MKLTEDKRRELTRNGRIEFSLNFRDESLIEINIYDCHINKGVFTMQTRKSIDECLEMIEIEIGKYLDNENTNKTEQ